MNHKSKIKHRKSNILCLYQHYSTPDAAAHGRLFTFLDAWRERYHTDLVTSRLWLDRRATTAFPDAPAGTTLHALDVPYDNAMGATRRLPAYLRFAWQAERLARRLPRPDVVYGISTPLTVGWAALRVARHFGVPFVFEVRDLWPDFPVAMGALPRRLAGPLYALERRLYREAAHVIGVSPDMTAHVRRTVPEANATTILQGTDFDLLDAVTPQEVARLQHDLGFGERGLGERGFGERGFGERRVVLYAGTLGRANAIPETLAALAHLAHRDDLAFVFMGAGFHADTVRQQAARQANVRLLPSMPRHRALAYFKLAALTLVPFLDVPVLATNAPAKLFDSLAAGTPVVVTNTGWTKELVETEQCGWYAPLTDPASFAARLAAVLDAPETLADAGSRGERYARAHFDRRALAARMATLFDEVVQRGAPAQR
ncbi:MAG: glycosyltransferase family 4 protein [Bacteroidota bacterium]